MKIQAKQFAIISSLLLSTLYAATPVLAADTMLSTGGYATEMHKMEMMKMLDTDGDHMVSSAEFDHYYGALFDALNRDQDDTLDAKEWVGSKNDPKISLATGGYSRELRSLKMMKMMDSDNDHLISRQEFIDYHRKLFTAMDKSGDQRLDPQEWLAKQTGN